MALSIEPRQSGITLDAYEALCECANGFVGEARASLLPVQDHDSWMLVLEYAGEPSRQVYVHDETPTGVRRMFDQVVAEHAS